jgi:hypothetical protein
MQWFKQFLFTAIFISASSMLFATHLVGASMSYKSLGNNRIEITLRVYRDCFQGIPSFDAPAYIAIFDSSNNRIKDLALSIGSIDTLSFPVDSCIDSNIYSSSSLCYEIGTYTIIDTLANVPGGYLLVYDRCCLPANFINIGNSLESGTSVILHIQDTFALNNNQSAYYSQKKIDHACTWIYNEIDKSAINADSDSLHYELITPHNSSRTISGNSHLAPAPPPYVHLIYAPTYSLNNPFGGYPISFDEDSAHLLLGPVTTGVFIYGIKIEEYRNGRYLGYSENVNFVYTFPYGSDTTGNPDGLSQLRNLSAVSVFPNPTHDVVYLKNLPTKESVRLDVFNQYGLLVHTSKGRENHAINLSNQPSGIYILRLNWNGILESRRIQKTE